MKVIRYCEGLSFEQFLADDKTLDAVMRNLEITGEAVRHLPPEFRDDHHEIQWRAIAGFRDVAIHAYPTVDEEIVWDIVQHKVPELLGKIETILVEDAAADS